MNARELRLRQRIDTLTDQRNHLLERNAELEHRIRKLHSRLADNRSRYRLWKHRATR